MALLDPWTWVEGSLGNAFGSFLWSRLGGLRFGRRLVALGRRLVALGRLLVTFWWRDRGFNSRGLFSRG